MAKLTTKEWLAAVPPGMRVLDRWCGFAGSKQPLDPRSGLPARVDDPTTFGTFKDARRWYEAHEAEPDAGCGFVFTKGDGLVFVDVDHCLDEAGGAKGWAQGILQQLESSTYAEVSPSGTGVHAFAIGELPRAEGVSGARLAVEDGAVEAYAERRFSTVTGARRGAAPLAKVDVALALPANLVAKLSRRASAPQAREPLDRRREAWDALQAVDPDVSNDEWVQVGMALKSAFGDEGLPLWRKWSSRGRKYKEGEPAQRWASFRREGVGLGTLFHMARRAGWRPAGRDADENAFDEPRRTFAVAPLSDFPDETYHWLVRDLGLLRGYAALLVGDGGHGKSTLMLDVAARLTTGRPMPWEPADHGREPCRVFYLNAEDGVGDTIKPRARAAGADLSRVDVLDLRAKGMRVPQLPEDVEDLEDMLLSRPDVQLVVIDPLNAFLGRDVDAHKAHDVRQALQPMRDALQRAARCVNIISHLNKNQALDAFYRISGSADQGNFVRAAMLVAPDPDADGVEVLSPLKWNYGPRPPSREFKVEDAGGDVGRIVWGEVSELTADETLRPRRETSGGATRLDEAEAWLRTTLSAGPMPSRELESLARSAGYARSTLNRAARRLGLRRERDGDGWRWPQVAPPFREEPQ